MTRLAFVKSPTAYDILIVCVTSIPCTLLIHAQIVGATELT